MSVMISRRFVTTGDVPLFWQMTTDRRRIFMHNYKRVLLFMMLLAGTFTLLAQPTLAQSGKQVYAFYFGWWTGDSWNDGRLSDRPLVPYNSWDGAAVGRHIDEARSAGI